MFLKHPRSSNLTLLKLFLATTTVFSLTVTGNALSQTGQSPFPRQMAWTAYNLGSTGYNQAVAIGAMLREKFGVTWSDSRTKRCIPTFTIEDRQSRLHRQWGFNLFRSRRYVSIC